MTVPSARELALKVLKGVEERDAYADILLDHWLNRHQLLPRERALATEIAFGTLRRRNTLDWVIEGFSSRPIVKMDLWTRNILRLGAYQLLYLERIPARAAVDEAVKLARRFAPYGVSGFVNAVLRRVANGRLPPFPSLAEDPLTHLSLNYSHPRWLVERWLTQLGWEGTAALCQANNQPPPVTLRVNRLKSTPAEAREALAAARIEVGTGNYLPEALVVRKAGSPERLPGYAEGWFSLQDESSMLVAHALDPQPGEMVVDMASAPGGKTTHLAEVMGNLGNIVAADVHEHRLSSVRERAHRLGIRIIRTMVADGRQLADLYAGQADRVLLDAPCSGLGVLRRNPEARWRKRPQDIPGLVRLQMELLAAGAQLLKPEGTLVYSTCTITPEENQGVVEGFLKRHPDFAREDLRPFLPEGLHKVPQVDEGWIQLYPHLHGTDGFFLARLRKGKTGGSKEPLVARR
ncbi:MAG: 16S rRNA (cytosine(967)-C(5))-methyltransferase RsmB [Firmicutes bacterium]|nr:16S rRNA (cytosine(967)-C(5))-methyltransferase RsmB [Bacillota bacterium]MCL5038289.1 16S rRNA (cytosine(967)-C(5))-methyltransferase RsmB [Bacillota bacterium]